MRLAIISCVLILFSLNVSAQTRPATQRQADEPGRGAMLLERLHNALEQLALTTEQRMKARRIVEQAQQRLGELGKTVPADGSGLREKFQEIMQDTRQRLQAILTSEQQQKFRSLMALGESQPSASPSTQPQIANLRVGQKAPDFSLRKLDGPTVSLSSFKGKIVLLVFGSYSSPMFRQHAAALEELWRAYVPRINFLIIYTRENYPAGEWDIERNKTENISIPQPSNMAARITQARQARDKLDLTAPFAVDSMDDKTAADYDGFSNAAVLIGRDGTVLFLQKWFEPYALRAAIEQSLKS